MSRLIVIKFPTRNNHVVLDGPSLSSRVGEWLWRHRSGPARCVWIMWSLDLPYYLRTLSTWLLCDLRCLKCVRTIMDTEGVPQDPNIRQWSRTVENKPACLPLHQYSNDFHFDNPSVCLHSPSSYPLQSARYLSRAGRISRILWGSSTRSDPSLRKRASARSGHQRYGHVFVSSYLLARLLQ